MWVGGGGWGAESQGERRREGGRDGERERKRKWVDPSFPGADLDIFVTVLSPVIRERHQASARSLPKDLSQGQGGLKAVCIVDCFKLLSCHVYVTYVTNRPSLLQVSPIRILNTKPLLISSFS